MADHSPPITRAEAERLDVSDGERLAPVTPGEVLREEFMAPNGLSAHALARDLGVSTSLVTRILKGERAVTAATALRLAQRFGTSAEFWMNLQTSHDLELAQAAACE